MNSLISEDRCSLVACVRDIDDPRRSLMSDTGCNPELVTILKTIECTCYASCHLLADHSTLVEVSGTFPRNFLLVDLVIRVLLEGFLPILS